MSETDEQGDYVFTSDSPISQDTVEVALEKRATAQRYLTHLHRLLDTHFDAEELRTLCFELSVDNCYFNKIICFVITFSGVIN